MGSGDRREAGDRPGVSNSFYLTPFLFSLKEIVNPRNYDCLPKLPLHVSLAGYPIFFPFYVVRHSA